MRSTHPGLRSLRPVAILAALGTLAALAAGPVLADRRIAPPELESTSASNPFLLKHTDVRVLVTGPVGRAIVTQTWHNPNPRPVDGLYLFPLPQDAAVSDMRLEIGERVVESDIKRRAEARRIYEQAAAQGRVAGLLDQERPNVFAQRVANIMPGMEIRVVLAYDQPLAPDGGRYELVFPTVVGPRFVPAHQADPGLVSPPVESGERGTKQRLSFRLDLEAGLPIYALGSSSHPVRVERHGEESASVILAENARLDRDVKVRWSVAGDEPELGLLAYRDPTREDALGTFTAIVAPPALPEEEIITPREIVFVLDCSGSMRGAPLDAAKEVVRKTLLRLHPRDSFQILRFSESASGMSARPLPNTAQNVQRALSYLDSLRGGGGTMMIEGIRASLDGRADEGRMRVVAFLTDGYIGNETEIFAEVRRLLGDSRLFAMGIGSSVNRYLLEGLAEEGRGVAAFRTPRESADDLVERFVRRIEAPVLTDVKLSFEDLEVMDIEPGRIPDLFAGQPLVIHGRYAKPGSGVMIVEGRVAGKPLTLRRVVTLFDDARDNEALGRLWARARIHRLERELHGREDARVVERITRLGLEHRLMTAYTSLVAVDSEISNASGHSDEVSVPVELPQDVPLSALGEAQMRRSLVASAPPAGHAVTKDSFAAAVAAEERALAQGLRRRKEYAPRHDARQALAAEASADAPFSFVSITLVSADGSRLVVEADGEVWEERGRARRRIATLSTSSLDDLADLVALCPPAGRGSRAGAFLEVSDASGRRAWALSGAPETVRALVRALEAIR